MSQTTKTVIDIMKRLLLALLIPTLLVSKVFAETYYIDDLVIKTSSDNSNCASGSKHSILVTGSIGPDSTFAVGKLIDQRKPCRDASGSVISPIEVILESGGGHLEDGYKLGDVFRAKGVTTIIPDSKMCASSCAVAFLGGKKRIVADTGSILFHAPYFKQMQLGGKERITCDLPKEELRSLNDYYNSMTSVEVGDRLYERTMWYCSATNGWTLKGGAANKLYGVATDSFDSITLIRFGKNLQPNELRLILNLSQNQDYQFQAYILEKHSRLVVEIHNIAINDNISISETGKQHVSHFSSKVWNDNGIQLIFDLKKKASIKGSYLLLNSSKYGPRVVIDLQDV